MPRLRARLTMTLLGGLLAAGLVLLVVRCYQHDLSAARARIAAGSQIAQTACGPIEYAVAGDGPPLLVVHGAGGGYDQGLDIARDLARSGLRVIAMSRFGYLRTPLPADASAAAQADAHACLLDALDIPRAAVLGASAGAPSAMQFALRHPERTSALILLVPATYVPRAGGAPPVKTPPGTEVLFDTALRSDFLFWLVSRLAPETAMRSLLATPPGVVESASASEQARVATMLDHILPVTPRRLGLLNDARVVASLQRYDLERIAAPTLLISLADDGYGTYEGARYTAAHVPHVRFIGYPSGGHLAVGHQQEIAAAILAFLTAAR
jgi:2-hydroxy-6-oxonona-2,4-dienedioate hydrolase